jgi:hypothetical protein
MKAIDEIHYNHHANTINMLQHNLKIIFPAFDQLKHLTSAEKIDIRAIKAVKVPNYLVAFEAVSEHLMDLVIAGTNPFSVRYMLMQIVASTRCKKNEFVEAFQCALFEKYEWVMRQKVPPLSETAKQAERMFRFFVKACESRIVGRTEIVKVYMIVVRFLDIDPAFSFVHLGKVVGHTIHFLPGKDPLVCEESHVVEDAGMALLDAAQNETMYTKAEIKMMMQTAASVIEFAAKNDLMRDAKKNNEHDIYEVIRVQDEYEENGWGYSEERDWYVTDEMK